MKIKNSTVWLLKPWIIAWPGHRHTVYPKKYAHGVCFAVLCCGYTLTDFPISIRLTSLALWQSNDCPSASKATLMNMDKYFMWIHYERLHNHNTAKHNKTVCIFIGIYCTWYWPFWDRLIFFYGDCYLSMEIWYTMQIHIIWHTLNKCRSLQPRQFHKPRSTTLMTLGRFWLLLSWGE